MNFLFKNLFAAARYSLREWAALGKELWDRLYSPILQPSYVFFFFVSMLIGATGVWVAGFEAYLAAPRQTSIMSIWEDGRVYNAIITFFTAVGALSCIQFIVVEDKLKNLRALFCLIMVTLILLAVLSAASDYRGSGIEPYFLIAGTTLAIVTWWIANWDEQKYKQYSSLGTLGGDSKGSAAGDTEGYSL